MATILNLAVIFFISFIYGYLGRSWIVVLALSNELPRYNIVKALCFLFWPIHILLIALISSIIWLCSKD